MNSRSEMNGTSDLSTEKSTNASSRVLQKLRTAMDSRNFYEAHQMYRTLYFRYLTQKQKHDELLQLLYDGSTRFLDVGQLTSGCDLALLFTEVLQKTSHSVDEKVLNRIEGIFERLITAGYSYEHDGQVNGESKSPSIDISSDRDTFVGNLIKWTKLVSPKEKYGHPLLHARLANTWWRMKNYEQARYHFMLSNDGEGCALFLVEYHLTKGYPGEFDLFVAQAVLQFLCHKDKSTANTVFFQYTQRHPRILARANASTATISKRTSSEDTPYGPPYVFPLLNFLWLLLISVDTGRVTDFTILVEKYQPSIKRDPSYLDYLDRIGQLYFGLPPPNKKATTDGFGGAFFRNLMSGLIGDEPEDGPSSADETFESVPGTPPANDPQPTVDLQRIVQRKISADETLD